ncbi:MAG: hypothetical protein RIG62_28995 [Cyclobacteriaceae bacterium]
MKKLYVKNTIDQKNIYRKLVLLPIPQGEFTYESTNIIAQGNHWQTDQQNISYQDLVNMYEDGYHTIEKEEFERAEALLKHNLGLSE